MRRSAEPHPQGFLVFLWRLPRQAAVFMIRLYQKTLSPDHSFWAKKAYPYGYCRFRPTCSEYACLSLGEKGLILGGMKAFFRILRCNPCSKGGEDWPHP